MLKLLDVSAVALSANSAAAEAQTVVFPGMPGIDDVRAEGVVDGNSSGAGNNGPVLPPTDALDEACTPTGRLRAYACNARFRAESHAVAVAPDRPDDLEASATMARIAVPVIPCR